MANERAGAILVVEDFNKVRASRPPCPALHPTPGCSVGPLTPQDEFANEYNAAKERNEVPLVLGSLPCPAFPEATLNLASPSLAPSSGDDGCEDA